MAVHPSLLAIMANAETKAKASLTVEAVGDASPTQIGVAGSFQHDVRITPVPVSAIADAATEATMAQHLCWDGAPGQWIADVDVADLASDPKSSVFRLGSLFDEPEPAASGVRSE